MARQERWKELSRITVADSIFHVATRYRGDVIIGGQTGNADEDDRLWVNENYPGSIHEGLNYWGFWAFNAPRVTRASAGALRLDGMTLEGGEEGGEEGVARIPAITATTLRWNVLFDDGVATWQAILAKCSDGTTVATSNVTAPSMEGDELTVAVPSLAAGSYLVRVRVTEATPIFRGLPDDYTAVSGQATRTPVQFRWIHPTLGAVCYDPIWNVGALPYDATATDQAALLAARAAVLTNGTGKKNPGWADALFEFETDGTARTRGGEWSMLRVVVGAGAWIGDSAVHAGATAGPARWTAGMTLTPVPAMIDPRMRSLGAFYQEEEPGAEVLWEGALIAGRSGRTVALYKRVAGTLEQTTLGTSVVAQRQCECALSSEQVTSIARDPHDGTLYLTTYCDRFRLDETTNTLIPAHPGGRSMVAARDAEGGSIIGYATESDFASSHLPGGLFNRVLTRVARGDGWAVGPGTAHHVAACVVAHAGALYGIEETGDASGFFTGTITPKSDRRQYLSRFSGGTWQRITGSLSQGWSCAERDLGPGARSRGGVTFFGEDADGLPTAIRHQGNTLEKAISGSYHPRNPQTVISADGRAENILAPARKRNEDGSLADGWYIVETTGLAATLLFIYDPECGDGGCFCIPLSSLVDAGVDASELPHCLQWTGDCWQSSACSGNYLELVVGETTACYHVHGTLPYDPTLLDGLEWMDGRACVNPIPAVANAREALERMPEGTTVHCHQVRYAEGGIISALQIVGTRDEETIEAACPFWCWLGTEALPDERGDAISGDMETALEAFTAPARLERPLWMELPRTDVFVCYLIPPTRAIAPVSKAIF